MGEELTFWLTLLHFIFIGSFSFFKTKLIFSTKNIWIFPKKVWPDYQKAFQEQEARQMEDICHYVKFWQASLDMSAAK